MSNLRLQLLASKWTLTLERHQMELDEIRREMAEAFGQENDCGNDGVKCPTCGITIYPGIDTSPCRLDYTHGGEKCGIELLGDAS